MKLPKLGKPKLDQVTNFFLPVFWGTRDDTQVARQMQLLAENVDPAYHFADNFFTWGRNNSMLEDPEFVKAFRETPKMMPIRQLSGEDMFSRVRRTTAYNLMETSSNAASIRDRVLRPSLTIWADRTFRRPFGLTISLNTAARCFITRCLSTGKACLER